MSTTEEEEKLNKLDEDAIKFQEEGNYIEALQALEAALILRKTTQGMDSEQVKNTSMQLCKLCNLLSMTQLDQENYTMAYDLLKKAEVLCESNKQGKAVTYNNLACQQRRINKLRSALKQLEKALHIENVLDYRGSNSSDTHLNICAVLSLLDKHEEALSHAMQALILLQEELLNRALTEDGLNKDDTPFIDRAAVLVIAYHNMGVQHEFLKRQDDALIAQGKAVDFSSQYLGKDNRITYNVTEVFESAKNQVEQINLNKWKRIQSKLHPIRRDPSYKEIDYANRKNDAKTVLKPNQKSKILQQYGRTNGMEDNY